MRFGKIKSATFINRLYGTVSVSSNTISNLVGSYYFVTPSGGAGSTDTLSTINFTSLNDGQILILRANGNNSEIILNSAGNILTRSNMQVTDKKSVALIYNSTLSKWLPLSRAGHVGFQGSQGTNGLQGSAGTNGSQGFQGDEGLQGSAGTNGSQGFQGDEGLQGTAGINGSQGFQGDEGLQGTAGSQGSQGFQGDEGLQGTAGSQGSQGYQGNLGYQSDSLSILGYQITYANLVSGIYTVNHNTGRTFWSVYIYDNNNKRIIPDAVTCTDANSLSIDLNSYGTFSGTWKVRLS